jgi:hypothetical protein
LPETLLALALEPESVDAADDEAAGVEDDESDFAGVSREDVSFALESPLALAAGVSLELDSLGCERVSVE